MPARKHRKGRRYVFTNPKSTRGSLAAYWARRAADSLENAGDKLTSRMLLETLTSLRWAMDDVSSELGKTIRKERRGR